MSAQPPSRLGRGLGALLAAKAAVEETVEVPKTGLRRIPIGQIRPNPYQPRKEFRPEDLADLESSLRVSGLLQPISVRPAATGTGFELIAGERRLRAAQRVGWTEIDAVIKTIDDQDLLSLALVENLQRADLNPIEEAEGYQRLIADFALTQQEVAVAVGKDRSTVANFLRLLALPASVRRLVWEGAITIGHARALLSLGDDDAIAALAKDVVSSGLSVREVERRVRERAPRKGRSGGTARSAAPSRADRRPAEARRIEDQLRRHLQTDVRLGVEAEGRGEIRIPFYSPDDLERVLDLVLGAHRDVE
jgi:ParB family transcriptional regulator, chromosome partitioning protein